MTLVGFRAIVFFFPTQQRLEIVSALVLGIAWFGYATLLCSGRRRCAMLLIADLWYSKLCCAMLRCALLGCSWCQISELA